MTEYRALIRVAPLLIAAAHPLFYIAYNLTDISVAPACIIMLLGAGQALLWYALGWVCARIIRLPSQGIRASALFALDALVFAMLPEGVRQHPLFASFDLGMGIYAAVLAAGFFYLWKVRESQAEWMALAGFATILCLFSLGRIVWGTMSSADYAPSALLKQVVHAYQKNGPQLPNVVYIIPDRYPSNDTLQRYYSFSNAQFTQALEAAGFKLRGDSHANYTTTFPSLVSVLNMDYLPGLVSASPQVNNERYLIAPFNRNAAFAAFDAAGYYTVFMGGAWNTLHSMNAARQNISLYLQNDNPLGIIERLYLDSTPMRYGLKLYFRKRNWAWIDGPIVGERKKWCENPVMQEKALYRALREDKPQFVFWHLYLPHPPYMHSADSEACTAPPRIRTEQEEKARFIDQLRYTNRLLLRVTEEAKKASRRPLIIVLQSDEGPYPWRIMHRSPAYFADMIPGELQVKFGNLNAIYMEDFPSGFTVPATPVNNFRILFNAIFKADLPLLEDRIFLKDSDDAPNKLYDITDKVH